MLYNIVDHPCGDELYEDTDMEVWSNIRGACDKFIVGTLNTMSRHVILT